MKGYPSGEDRIVHYTSRRISGPPGTNGDLGKPAWKEAQKSSRFVDLVSGEPAFLDTRMANLWDEKNLYAENFSYIHFAE